MKRFVVFGAVCASLVVTASAQLSELLPIAANADIANGPSLSVDAGICTASDFTGFGVRAQYKLSDELAAYGTIVLPEDGTGFGGGVIYALGIDLPVIFAVRGGIGYWSYSEGAFDVSILDVNGALVASGSLDEKVSGLGWYANVGLHYLMWEAGHADDTETAFQFGGGLTYAVTDMVTVFGGADIVTGDYIDETFIGAGVRVALDSL